MVRWNWGLVILTAGLVMVGGLGLSSVSEAAGRKNKKAPKPPPPPPAQPPAAVVVDGYGRDAREARKHALGHVQEELTELLRDRAGAPDWTLPADLLAPEVLERYGVIVEVGKPEPIEVAVGEDKAMKARYEVHLTDEYLRAVQKHAREDRMLDRHLLLTRVLGGLLAVLLVTAGYLRLEEMTRGYATQLLRLGAFAILGLAGFVIWLTM